MDPGRAKRAASKVQDYRKFHLSRDIPHEGTIAATIKRLESPHKNSTEFPCNSTGTPRSTPRHSPGRDSTHILHHSDSSVTDSDTSLEVQTPGMHTIHKMANKEAELIQQLKEHRAQNEKLQQEMRELQIQSEIALEKQKKEQWETALGQIKEAQNNSKLEHEKQLNDIQALIKTMMGEKQEPEDLVDKLRSLLLTDKTAEEERLRKEKEARQAQNKLLVEQLVEQQMKLQEQAKALAESELD